MHEVRPRLGNVPVTRDDVGCVTGTLVAAGRERFFTRRLSVRAGHIVDNSG